MKIVLVAVFMDSHWHGLEMCHPSSSEFWFLLGEEFVNMIEFFVSLDFVGIIQLANTGSNTGSKRYYSI
jgi:hypothetical protein